MIHSMLPCHFLRLAAVLLPAAIQLMAAPRRIG
jgi:hypothetical protein